MGRRFYSTKKKDEDRIRSTWSEHDLGEAIKQIQAGKISVNRASKTYSIPRRTLRDYISKNLTTKQKLGTKGTLNEEQEAKLVGRIIRLSEVGFPLTTKSLQKSVFEFCEMEKIPHKFNGIAGRDWLYAFLERHPEISRRRAQNLNEARCQKLNKFIVNDYFDKLEAVLDENELRQHPERIYNMDEKGMRLCLHKSPTVLAKKGAKRVKNRGKEHGENVTVVACVNAIGNSIPPMILFKGKNVQPGWIDDLPTGSKIQMTDKGSMTKPAFVNWLKHFAQFKTNGTCLLVYDGASSHIDVSILKEAERHDIILFCLPSNTSHELQPLDKSIFRPLEINWDNELLNFWKNCADRTLNKYRFGKIFTPAWEKSILSKSIRNGFLACGIYPFNRDAIPEEAFKPAEVTNVELPNTQAAPDVPEFRDSLSPVLESASAVPKVRENSRQRPNAQSTPVRVRVREPEVAENLGSEVQTVPTPENCDNSSSRNDSLTIIFGTPKFKAVASTSRGRSRAMNSRALLLQRSVFPPSPSEKSVTDEPKPKLRERKKRMAKNKKKPENPKDSSSESEFCSDDEYMPKKMKKPSPKKVFKKKLSDKLKKKSSNPKKIEPKGGSESWYCFLCREDDMRSMRKCDGCQKYVHEDCIGYCSDDPDSFTCPKCM